MKEALRNFMLSKTAITDIVASRIYSAPAPRNAEMPYIVMRRIVEMPTRNLAGPCERYRETWQIDCYAETDEAAETLKNAVRDELDICAPTTMGAFKIHNIFMESSADLSEIEIPAGQMEIFRKEMTFAIIRDKNKTT